MATRYTWPTVLLKVGSGSRGGIDLLEVVSDTKAMYGKAPKDGHWSLTIHRKDGEFKSTHHLKHLDNKMWRAQDGN